MTITLTQSVAPTALTNATANCFFARVTGIKSPGTIDPGGKGGWAFAWSSGNNVYFTFKNHTLTTTTKAATMAGNEVGTSGGRQHDEPDISWNPINRNILVAWNDRMDEVVPPPPNNTTNTTGLMDVDICIYDELGNVVITNPCIYLDSARFPRYGYPTLTAAECDPLGTNEWLHSQWRPLVHPLIKRCHRNVGRWFLGFTQGPGNRPWFNVINPTGSPYLPYDISLEGTPALPYVEEDPDGVELEDGRIFAVWGDNRSTSARRLLLKAFPSSFGLNTNPNPTPLLRPGNANNYPGDTHYWLGLPLTGEMSVPGTTVGSTTWRREPRIVGRSGSPDDPVQRIFIATTAAHNTTGNNQVCVWGIMADVRNESAPAWISPPGSTTGSYWFRLDTYNKNPLDAFHQHIAEPYMFRDGTTLVVWADWRPAPDAGLYGRMFYRNGSPYGAEFPIHIPVTTLARPRVVRPDIAASFDESQICITYTLAPAGTDIAYSGNYAKGTVTAVVYDVTYS